jgi:extracellular factor (EF) 3-hydroxypalmitic acid methyl ester biosynthesis protein
MGRFPPNVSDPAQESTNPSTAAFGIKPHIEIQFADIGKLAASRIAEALQFSRPAEYVAGEQVVIEGSESRCLYYLEKGSLEVSYRVGDTPIIVALIGPSSFFGEIGFFDGQSRVRNIRATEDSIIRLFDLGSVTEMRMKNPLLFGDFISMMAQSICDKFRRILEEREPLTSYAASLSTGRRTPEEAKPIPPQLLKTEKWRFANKFVEEFKTSFFEITYVLQQDQNTEVPHPLKERCFRVMDNFNGRLQAAAALFREGESADYLWGYTFKEIFPYFMRSRFAERAYYKPNGYAGDHLTMEMIYANEPEGDGKLGRIIDDWCLDTAAARAVRGRRKFLKDQLEKLCNQKQSQQPVIKIMNLACGSNRELFDFLAGCDYTARVAAVCIDADPKALEYTHRRVDTFPHEASVKLMKDNVVLWAIGRTKHNFGLNDIIYSAGLTDYLEDRIFLSLINRSYECLGPGGTLIIGNFGPGNYNRAFLDHILQWKLIHRSEEELLDLFSRSRFGGRVRILTEESGINLFAMATRVE